MKKMKLFATMCVALLMSTLCLTSCNTDDGYNPLTPEQIRTAFLTIQGTHVGKLIFLKNTGSTGTGSTAVTDTVAVSWSIDTDSTMTVHNFPARALTEFISTSHSALKAAVAEQPNQNLECVIGIVQPTPVGFMINPKTLTYNVYYDGMMHKVQFAFWLNSYSSVGIYSTAQKSMEMQMLLGGIYVDDQLLSDGLTEQAVQLLFQSQG